MAVLETIRVLAERIRTLQTACRSSESTALLVGGGLSELFPAGLAAGSLVELLPRGPGAGAWTLALLLAKYACGEQKTLLIADPESCFYPPAVLRFGVEASRIVIIRPRKAGDAVLGLAQALRCSAIGAGIGAFERLADREGRRLQTGGGVERRAGGPAASAVRARSAFRLRPFAC